MGATDEILSSLDLDQLAQILGTDKASAGRAAAAAIPTLIGGLQANSGDEDGANGLLGALVPALLVWGDKDTATPLSDGQQMEKLMPEAGLAVIEGAGHYSFLDNPVLYQRILGSFLQIKL